MTVRPASRLLVIAGEPLWPTTHGARVDQWNRYLGLRQEGWDLMLAYWHEVDAPQPVMPPLFGQTLALEIQRSGTAKLRRAAGMLHQPSLAALRFIDDRRFATILDQVRDFEPSIVICETVYCLNLARRLAVALDLPLVIRSHNIEHRYMATQFRLATSWRQRLQILAARLHLRRFESDALRMADAVFDISASDTQFWTAQGISNVHWVPTFLADRKTTASREPVEWTKREFDIGYLGNLWGPNNIAALIWFLDDILPKMRATKPDLSVLIAGSNPRPELVARIKAAPNATLMPDPEDAGGVRANIRVLINPIREGSGLNTKSIEMLFCDSPIVATPFAIQGMDEGAAAAFIIAKDAANFAQAALRALDRPFELTATRQQMRLRYGRGGARVMSRLLHETVERHRRCVPKGSAWH